MNKKLLISFLLILYSLQIIESIYISSKLPQEEGDLTVATFEVPKDESSGLPYKLEIFSPTKSDQFSLVVFLGGWEGNLPASAYGTILTHLSSHGFVVVGIDTAILIRIKPTEIVDNINLIQKWITLNLENTLRANLNSTGKSISVDISGHSFFLGHSAGAQMLVRTLESGCGLAKGLVLIDPVDGVDPFGITKDFAITPGQFLNFTTSTLVIGTGLGGVPGIHIGKLFPACAPTALNYNRFYDALRCSKWLINATDFGHIDFLDDSWIKFAKGIHFCASNSSANISLFRQFTAGLVTSYALGVIQGRCEVLSYLEKPSSMMTGVNVKTQSDDTCQKCATPSCQFTPNKKAGLIN